MKQHDDDDIGPGRYGRDGRNRNPARQKHRAMTHCTNPDALECHVMDVASDDAVDRYVGLTAPKVQQLPVIGA